MATGTAVPNAPHQAPGRSPGMQTIGESQQVFSEQVRARREELRAQGEKPYTIVNFNPTELTVRIGGRVYRIPSPYDDRLPSDVSRVVMAWRGRDYPGHAMTIRESWIEGRNVNAKGVGGPGEVAAEREVVAYSPQAIAYSFLEHYSTIFATPVDGKVAPAPTDARRICGTLAFEGRLDALEPGALSAVAGMIRVPVARVIAVGKINRRIYESVDYPLERWKDQMFDGQKRYADTVISRAQQKFNEGQARQEIGSAERTWYRWAIRMGYTQKPTDESKTWLNELISLTETAENGGGMPLRKCPGCRAQEPELDTPFCPKCGRPMDVFRTFMAGFDVAPAYLALLTGEELELAKAEYQRRQELATSFGGGAQPAQAATVTTGAEKAQRGPGGRFAPKPAEPNAGKSAGA